MIKENEVNPSFKFYISHDLKRPVQIWISQLKTRFQKWLLTKDVSYIESQTDAMHVSFFISHWLNYGYNSKDLPELVRLMKKDINTAIEKLSK